MCSTSKSYIIAFITRICRKLWKIRKSFGATNFHSTVKLCLPFSHFFRCCCSILWTLLMRNICREPTDVGMKRLALTDADKKVREWFVDTTKSLGCSVKIDTMGNYSKALQQMPKTEFYFREHFCSTPRKEIWPCYIRWIASRYPSEW